MLAAIALLSAPFTLTASPGAACDEIQAARGGENTCKTRSFNLIRDEPRNTEAGGRLRLMWQQKMLFCRVFSTEETGLEPAISGVTGRSWRLRPGRGLAAISGKSRTSRLSVAGIRRVLAGASASLVRDEREKECCLDRQREQHAVAIFAATRRSRRLGPSRASPRDPSRRATPLYVGPFRSKLVRLVTPRRRYRCRVAKARRCGGRRHKPSQPRRGDAAPTV
jgi:hypothetical protein